MDPAGNLEWFEGLDGRGIAPGLDNIRELMRRLGDPQDGMRFIHVAGTDGKGSVCAMIESILKASGIRVGAFTSPHIIKINECIRISGDEMPDRDLDQMLSEVRAHVDAMDREGKRCTRFEVLTAVAFLYFKTVSAEICVIEVGMGGRLDCTNIIVPEVTVINDIELEHTAFLGDTVEKIAFEKAGIMKPGVPCVTINDGSILEVLESRASEVGCELVHVDRNAPEVMGSQPDHISMVYKGDLHDVFLPGRHQARNAALAIECVSRLPEYEDTIKDSLDEGLASVVWPCRMQKLLGEPVVIDVSHTLSGAKCLASDIGEIYGKVILVLGMLNDKDIEGFCRVLGPVVKDAFITAPASPRASPADRTAEIASGHMHVAGTFGTVAEALEAALESRDDEIVLVTGSFRTAEDALTWLQNRYATS